MQSQADYEGLARPVQIAVLESALLHLRILTDILLSRGTKSDDINLSLLLPGFTPTDLGQLETAYGGPKVTGSPYWTLNKMLAHPTTNRSDSHDYKDLLNTMCPIVGSLIDEISAERNRRGLA